MIPVRTNLVIETEHEIFRIKRALGIFHLEIVIVGPVFRRGTWAMGIFVNENDIRVHWGPEVGWMVYIGNYIVSRELGTGYPVATRDWDRFTHYQDVLDHLLAHLTEVA